ncbi:putative 1-phosphatidylinositol-3-phosphate 5-kinase FAB1C [Salvia miltiorrhiza]|uniref:putative 1-phosphatidylinositol-3-phosphate 5-kinase FAB1C n=1 Tax=Salvia miltiorrhiza TaxID=226208 RepID=UPI0025ABC687|nr:putative 1-phosphatidylinositol-3-phosphate 5-kinase FAB1C [Salvia miltiorrhiza]
MGMHSSSLLQFIQKFQSWMSWGNSDTSSIFRGFERMDNDCSICSKCARNVLNSYPKYQCRVCGNLLCDNCSKGLDSLDGVVPTNHLKDTAEAVIYTMSCKICSELSPPNKSGRRCSGKVYPSESPRQSPEPPSPSFSGEGSGGHSPLALTRSSDVSLSNHPSLVSAHCSSRSYDDEGEHSISHFFSIPNEYFRDASDVDSSSVSVRHEFYSAMSLGSSPSDSPSRSHTTSSGVGCHVQLEQGGTAMSQDYHEQAVLERPAKGIWDAEDTDDLPILRHTSEELPQPLDFENNGLIWFPPPPDDANDEVENNLFTYDDEDDEIGDSGVMFLPTATIGTMFSAKEKQYHDGKGPWRSVVQGHFRALVSQLLQGQGIIITGKDNSADDWLEIVTTIAWQAAKFLKPDTSRGGSMDPCDYLKVKCVASGSPQQSKFIKGVVCTKNIKHKRMTSQYKNARLLLLGGALEYQRIPNQLASFETLLQQENDHLKTIVSKIEAHRPNVLLVEKSVSSFALEHLLAKEISLVLNVKRPLLEKIARCTGASITPSTDHISTTRLGHCEIFRLEKVSEDHEPVNQSNRKPSKTLMFFEGCPRRLGCTVVLRGSCREELRKLKHVTQYAVFAAYHLSLETSFLVDEGASLPKAATKSSGSNTDKMPLDQAISVVPDSAGTISCTEENKVSDIDLGAADLTLELGLQESLSELGDVGCDDVSISDEFRYRKALSEACIENLALDVTPDDQRPTCSSVINHTVTEAIGQEESQTGVVGLATLVHGEDTETSSEYFSANDSHHSILVSFSSHNVANGTVCERSRLVRLKFYGNSDKPLGRFLRDDLFDQSFLCRSCKEPAEAHVMCYTHQHANLTINVRRLLSVKLPGEQDGKIWMWHRCLRCEHTEGVPPATQRVVMSDAAWGLSFGKFLELSFSNHATGNRVASCGHSLQRDCLRFYGFGNMVAFFRYSPINILSVRLPPSTLEFGDPGEQPWLRKEAYELLSKAKALHAEISRVLDEFKSKCLSSMDEFSDANELHNHVMELNGMLCEEKTSYEDLLQFADKEAPEQYEAAIDILEINRMRHSLLVGSKVWDRRLFLLDSLLKRGSSPKAATDVTSDIGLKNSDSNMKDNSLDLGPEDDVSVYPKLEECASDDVSQLESGFLESYQRLQRSREDLLQDEENAANSTALERTPSAGSILSDKIDSAWSGADLVSMKSQSLDMSSVDASETLSFTQRENPVFRRLTGPARVHSFDSAQRLQERIRRGLPPSSMYLSNIRSFHASGDYRHMVRDPVVNVQRTYSQVSVRDAEKFNLSSTVSRSFISSLSLVPEGARLMVLQNGHEDVVVTVYDNEPTSIISYALSSKEYDDWVAGRLSGTEIGSNVRLLNKVNSLSSELSTWQSFGSMDSDYMNYGSYGSDDGSSISDQDNSPHLRISFEDESSNAGGKVKFSVTCYYAKQFDSLRRKCCPCEVDFVRSLSRCKRWSAQGGKSNVYFAKSFDDRFIIKQVTKTELESFEEFAPQYFKYLKDALTSGSPTCLAKVLGIFQVTVKKSGKEVKMDLMVMENLFYKRNISKVYDLKGSSRSRYNSDKTGANKVLLDMNLLETLRTNPIFLGGKAKRNLERAVWNDTSFLASVDVMDYSLLVGVDEERKELVMGIIDFMRQYTWDKHLETWVKASGILGGPKNASPTIISPKQYKKRFRKAMTTYFLTVPDQWYSS